MRLAAIAKNIKARNSAILHKNHTERTRVVGGKLAGNC